MPDRIPLELTGLTKTFQTDDGPFVAVENVNILVREGEFVCILGHSGCGKSTVLSIIAGLQKATFGGVVIDGTQVDEPGADRAVVFQSPSLLPMADRAPERRARDEAGPAPFPAFLYDLAEASSNIWMMSAPAGK